MLTACSNYYQRKMNVLQHWPFRRFTDPRWNCLSLINTLRPRQNGHHFADDIFKRIFLNDNIWIQIQISKFVPKGSINNIPALVKIMAWRRPGDKPLSEPMMVSLLTHICVTRPQWVNTLSCLKTASCPICKLALITVHSAWDTVSIYTHIID